MSNKIRREQTDIYIEINGNLFEYHKKPTNTTNNIMAGDIATNGWCSNNIFGRVLVFVSGTPTNLSSWRILDSIEF